MISLLRTIVIFFILVVSMLVIFPPGLLFFVFSFLGLKKPMSVITYRMGQIWARFIIMCTGCKLTVKGVENIPKKGGMCIVSNHGSIFDIAIILAFAGRPFGFIAKKELILVPFLNIWIFLLDGLFIDRKNPRKALGTINSGIKKIKAGGAMLIFPEGTRSRGKGLLPFRPGSFKLATHSDALIVPAAILGSYDVFEKTGRTQAVPVSVAFAPAITTAGIPPENRRQALADRVHAVIAQNLAEAQGALTVATAAASGKAASENAEPETACKTGPENRQP